VREKVHEEGDEVPRDFTPLFDQTLHGLDSRALPDAVRAFKHLRIEHGPLRVIPPAFETPLPPLTPAVFPASFRELDAPALELFDLDDQFASERARLAQLTNKCAESGVGFMAV
jgi:intraflagellar transport protein 52